jgi:anaerobic selenocysteine-containing dehydrogenase
MHVVDAERLGIRDGDRVRVRSRRGSVEIRARVARKVREGVLWMPFHFVEAGTNLLTNDAFDNVTRTAEYKACAAAIERVSP